MKKIFIALILFLTLPLFGRNTYDTYNNYRTALPEGIAVSRADHPYISWHISWGINEDVDSGDLPEEVWAAGGEYPFSTSGQTWFISSDDAADVGVIYAFELLDSNFNEIKTAVVLNGTTPVQIFGPLGQTLFYRINNAVNYSNIEQVGNIYIYESGGTVSGGVPDDETKIRAMALARHQQALQCIYTVPANKSGHLNKIFANVLKGGNGNWANLGVQVRSVGGVFRTVGEAGVNDGGNGFFIYDINPPAPLMPGTDLRMRIWDVESNSTQVGGGFHIDIVDLTNG